MKKTCLKCGKNTDGNDYCFQHKPRTQLQRGKPASKKDAGNSQQLNEMKQFFMDYWRTHKPHVCENCNTHLGKEPLTYMFDHILEKSKHPELAFEEENIMYLCLSCHDKKTRGHLSSIIEERIEYLKNKFNI